MVEYIKYTPELSNNWSRAWSETQKQRPWQSRRLLDSSTTSQLQGKLWLVNELQKLYLKFSNVCIIGGWFAQFITPLMFDNFDINFIKTSFANEIKVNKQNYKRNQVFKLPDVILKSDDIFSYDEKIKNHPVAKYYLRKLALLLLLNKSELDYAFHLLDDILQIELLRLILILT